MKSLRRTNRLEKETFRLFWQVNTVQKQKRAINWLSFREISRPLTVKSELFPQYEDQLDFFDWFVSQPVVKKTTIRKPGFLNSLAHKTAVVLPIFFSWYMVLA